MSVDLDRLYAKLAEKADSTSTTNLSGVLTKARQIRRRRITTTVSVVLVFVLFGSSAYFLTPPKHEQQFTYPPPISFVGWDKQPEPVIRYGAQTRVGFVITDDKRAYTLWHEVNGPLKLGAIDLATDMAAWPPADLGKFGDTMAFAGLTAEVVFVIGEHDDGTQPDYVFFAIDTAAGKLLWQRGFDFNAEQFGIFPGAVVFSTGERTEGLDLRSGRPKWTVNEPVLRGAGAVAWEPNLSSMSLWSFNRDTRLVQVHPDGRLRVRDAATGQVLSERSGVPVIEGGYRVIDGQLYLDGGKQIQTMSVTGTDAPIMFYTARNRVERLAGCGPLMRCVFDPGEVVGVEAKTGRELWRRPAAKESRWLFVSETGVLLLLAEASPVMGTAIYAFDGTDIAPPGLKDRSAQWIDGGNLLISETPQPLGETMVSVKVSGYSFATGQETPLGTTIQAGFCSITTTKLICPGEDGFVVYQFAR